jgi:hypothetical protein
MFDNVALPQPSEMPLAPMYVLATACEQYRADSHNVAHHMRDFARVRADQTPSVPRSKVSDSRRLCEFSAQNSVLFQNTHQCFENYQIWHGPCEGVCCPCELGSSCEGFESCRLASNSCWLSRCSPATSHISPANAVVKQRRSVPAHLPARSATPARKPPLVQIELVDVGTAG